MVDCGNLRCFQERRSIKKELLSWSKKVPIAVGLETIAEYVGSKRKVRKVLEPFRCLEPEEVEDWEPEENCFYCKDRIQLLFDAIEKTDSKGGGRILRDHPSLRHLGEILPFCPQFYTSNFGRDILSDIKTSQNEAQSTQAPPTVEVTPPKPGIELKIPHVQQATKQKKESSPCGKKGYSDDDLSAAVLDVKNGKLGTRRASTLYGVPRSTLRNKVFKMEVDESSLSSHITEEDTSSNEGAPPAHYHPYQKQQQQQLHDQYPQPLLLSDLLQLSTLQYLSPVSFPYLYRPEVTIDPEWERRLEQIRRKHNLAKVPMNHYKEKALRHKLRPYQKELIRKLALERLQLELKAAKSTSSGNNGSNKHSPSSQAQAHSAILKALEENTPFLHHHGMMMLDHHQMYDHTPFSHVNLLKALNIDPLITSVTSNADNASQSKIVIPEYIPGEQDGNKNRESLPVSLKTEPVDRRPYEGLFKYENTRIGDTLKDIIVKTISEKVKCTLESTDFASLVGSASSSGKQKAKETILSAFSIPETCSPAKKSKREHHNASPSTKSVNGSSSSCSNSSASGSQQKKTRPKRGQYRKYNSQLLTEAVKAVQRGEMSVHRAGSYYGVPHSTLEYKVKERHLLRQKKIKEQQEQKVKKEAEDEKQNDKESSAEKPNGSDVPLSTNAVVTAEGKTSHSASDLPSHKGFFGPTWMPPFVSPAFSEASALGMFGAGFALSTPASELLRKLQHKVQS